MRLITKIQEKKYVIISQSIASNKLNKGRFLAGSTIDKDWGEAIEYRGVPARRQELQESELENAKSCLKKLHTK